MKIQKEFKIELSTEEVAKIIGEKFNISKPSTCDVTSVKGSFIFNFKEGEVK